MVACHFLAVLMCLSLSAAGIRPRVHSSAGRKAAGVHLPSLHGLWKRGGFNEVNCESVALTVKVTLKFVTGV